MPLFGDELTEGTLYWNLLNPEASSRRMEQPDGVWSVALVFPLKAGWFSIGLPALDARSPLAHVNSDMITFVIDELNPEMVILSDRWSNNATFPELDTSLGGEDNLVFPQGIVTPDGQLYVKFQRKYVTGDVFDQPINILGKQFCSFAFSTQMGTLYHGRANQRVEICNFGNITDPTTPPNRYSLIVAHGVLGALGIGLFLTVGGFFYRYLWCVPVKVRGMLSNVLFVLGGLLVLISFIIAGVMVSQASGEHYSFDTASMGGHGVTSLIAFIGTLLFVLVRLFTSSEKRADDNVEYRLFQYAGWVVLVLTIMVGWPAIFLGFVDQENTHPWLWVIGAIMIFLAVVALLGEIIRCLKMPKDDHSDIDENDVELTTRPPVVDQGQPQSL